MPNFKSISFNPISAEGGGGIHPPPGFSLAIATKNQPIDSKLFDF